MYVCVCIVDLFVLLLLCVCVCVCVCARAQKFVVSHVVSSLPNAIGLLLSRWEVKAVKNRLNDLFGQTIILFFHVALDINICL